MDVDGIPYMYDLFIFCYFVSFLFNFVYFVNFYILQYCSTTGTFEEKTATK